MIITPELIIGLFGAVFLIDAYADYLNLKVSRLALPHEIAEVQSSEMQTRASQYLEEKVRFSFVKGLFFTLLFIALLKAGFFAWLYENVAPAFASTTQATLTYVAILAAGQGLLSLPFQAYSTFSIEARFGFNRTDLKTFLGDILKGAVLGLIIGGLLFTFFIKFFEHYGASAWFRVWLGYTVFQLFLVWIAPVTLLPLFMKLTPLTEGSLSSAISEYAKKQKFTLGGVWISDASKRSAKSNAFFTGFGKFRRLVLFDTLVAQHSEKEIVAIVAHEAGHFKLGHIWKMSLSSGIMSLVFFYCLQQLIELPSLKDSFGFTSAPVGVSLILAIIVFSKALFFVSPISSFFSRRNEFAADAFSLKTTHDQESLAQGLKRLVTANLSTIVHHPLYVILHDSHPPLPNRLRAIEQNARKL